MVIASDIPLDEQERIARKTFGRIPPARALRTTWTPGIQLALQDQAGSTSVAGGTSKRRKQSIWNEDEQVTKPVWEERNSWLAQEGCGEGGGLLTLTLS